MHLCVHVCTQCKYLPRLGEDVEFPEAGVIGVWELPDV